ncbi:MAG: recombinase family protein [Parafilimonas terrae]|nr:recombinase family protein [Parafilimonas terrae]
MLSATFEERGASATSDKGRPQLKALLDQACDGSRPYDVVVVHSLSRLFRNQFALEGARRRLAEHGVGLISITQPLAGNDPASHLIRNVLAMFDEYQS